MPWHHHQPNIMTNYYGQNDNGSLPLDEVFYRPRGQGLETGSYEFLAIITHKSQSADGGYYISWVHVAGDD